jgi:peptidyl-dipeptidase Dcp
LNPFLIKSTLEYELPPFALISEIHYLEAFHAGMNEQLHEIDAILANPHPNFDNTIAAMERSGATLTRDADIEPLLRRRGLIQDA